MTAITATLAAAFDRIDDFESVQARSSDAARVEAAKLLQAAVGIDEDERRLVAERIEQIRPGAAGHVLLGVIVGLLAAQLEAERA